ncbi:MAG: putative porin, partial [Candidatus Omnitrophota bacterium]
YASYAPYEDVQLLAGKMKNPYQCSDLTWGADVRPEGIAVNVTSNIMEDMNTALKLTLGYFNVYNSATGSNEDINLFAPQIGATTKFDNDYTLDLAVAMYTFDNYKGTSAATLQEDRGGNTTSGGLIANDFSVLNPMIKLDAPSVLDAIDIPFGVYAEMLENSEADDNSSGYRIGLRIGMAKLKEVNDWNFVYELSRLEADAFPDAFGDASWGPIGTDTKGSKLSLSYQLAKNFGIGLTYFDLSKISADSDKTIGQLDFNVKF